MAKPRKSRVSYEMVEAGLNRHLHYADWERYLTPVQYIRVLKRETGLADWKIASDLGKDAGVEVTAATVRNWRLKGGTV